MALGEVSSPRCTWAVYTHGLRIPPEMNAKDRNAELEGMLSSGKKSTLVMGIKVRYGT